MTTLAFIEGILSPTHMIILLVIALLVFGHRLPQVARGMGKSIVEFKKGLKDVGEEVEESSRETPRRSELPRNESYHSAQPLPTSGNPDVRVTREQEYPREQAR